MNNRIRITSLLELIDLVAEEGINEAERKHRVQELRNYVQPPRARRALEPKEGK